MDGKLLDKTAKLFNQAIAFFVLKPVLKELTENDITEVQLSCLRFANLHPEPSVGAIAEGLKISNAASAKLVDRLVKKRLLLREEDTQDRRVLKIKLTAGGAELLESINSMELQRFNSIWIRMSKEEQRDLEDGLVAFLKAALFTPEQLNEICLRCGSDHMLECPGNILYRGLTGHDKEEI